MFEGLNAIPWAELTHAYGSAEQVPMWLRQLRSPDADVRHNALNDLWGSICHQNWIAPATAYTVPYLIELLADPEIQDKNEILDLLADIATCAPLYEPQWRENEDVPTWNVPEHIPFKDAHLEAEKGIGVYLTLLQANDAKIRMSAANVLTAFPTQRAEIYPALLIYFGHTVESSERANAVLALGKLSLHEGDNASLFFDLFQTEQSDLARFAAALALIRIADEETPQEVAGFLAEIMESDGEALKEYQDLPCGGGWASFVARAAVYCLKPARMRFLLPHLRRMINDTRRKVFERNDILVMLLYIIFEGDGDPSRYYEKPARPIRSAEALTPGQQEILISLCASGFGWLNALGNTRQTLAAYDLPRSQKDLADYLGIPLPEPSPQKVRPAPQPHLPPTRDDWSVAANARSERVRAAFPELRLASWRSSSKYVGQNNALYTTQSRTPPNHKVTSEYVFRFPQNQRAIDAIEIEVALLRALQDELPSAIPNPLYTLFEPREVGQVCMGYEKIPGKPFYREMLESVDGDDAVRKLATQLGEFLKALHALGRADFDFPLPVTNSREVWIAFYDRVTQLLLPKMRPDARDAVTYHFESSLARAEMWDWTPVLIQGDFGPGNILYDARRRAISGIIDFSSAGLGDPATDFAAVSAPTSYPQWFVELIAETYGASRTMLDRTAFYIGTFALQEALHGLDTSDTRAYDAGMKEYI